MKRILMPIRKIKKAKKANNNNGKIQITQKLIVNIKTVFAYFLLR